MRRSPRSYLRGRDPRRGRSPRRRFVPVLGLVLTPIATWTIAFFLTMPLLRRLHASVATLLDQRVGWRNLPLPLQLFTLDGVRWNLRSKNLFDTSTPTTNYPPIPRPEGGRHLVARTMDGTYNDLQDVRMGSAGTRFGRNVPIEHTYSVTDALMQPNPRTVSRELLTRTEFVPATTLNVLAAAWLQFMIRDWFSHGKSPKDNPWQVPIEPNDPWPDKPMQIMRTRPDPTRSPAEADLPPTYSNTESHWWDGSQIYGSNLETQLKARSGQGGKLSITPQGFPPIDPNPDPNLNPVDQPGFWLGLAMLRIIFTLEHNSICDRLLEEYPAWSDDDLFDKARLINSALLAKIHTVEWTTAILGHPALQIGMRANWWGLEGEKLSNLIGRISKSEIISGIPGGPQDNFGVPYSLTEEFVAVYRMHPLIPDDYQFRSVSNDALLQEDQFGSLTNRGALNILQQISMSDLLYSFGIAHPGAVVLHNFPRGLQNFHRPDGNLQDLAATDILRSRELGVPRYNEFRRLLHLNPIARWEDLTPNEQWRADLRRVYGGNVEQLDLTVGMFAETPPPGFGFSDTAFRIFVLMASRRLNSDRFFTTDFTERVYTKAGMDWLRDNTMSTVLLRHYPSLAPPLREVKNAFAPWTRVPQ